MSLTTELVIIWLGEFAFDVVIENTIIRWTHAYGYSKTYKPLTLFSGKFHQFPIYGPILIATLGSAFSRVRLNALDDPEGVSVIENGYKAYPKILHGPIRLLAVIGFCSLSAVLMYHLPLNWLGIIGDSYGDLPSYMLPGSATNSTRPIAYGF